MKRIDVPAGTVFGRLTVIGEAEPRNRRRMMICRCECGNEKILDIAKLRSGHTQSCGCLHREVVAELARTNPLIAEYRTSDKRREQTRCQATKHGLSHHPHRVRWWAMMERCYNPDHPGFHLYGGRGITVCPGWHDLATFCAWMDANLGVAPKGMTLDRINNDGDYEPGNVKWSTQPEQLENSRACKLGMAAAAEIRARHAAGEGRQALAVEYGVSVTTIRLVVIGETWRESA